MKKRIYVCHTFYHVYIAFLKEFALGEDKGATLVLSTMSNNFGRLKERIEELDFFDEVYMFDEQNYQNFEDLVELKKDKGNIISNMWSRHKYSQELAKKQEAFVPVDFAEYKDIYVFCDSDPIGYYLSYKKLRYHALEDGLNCIAYCDTARFDNRGFFSIKTFLSKKINFIFIQNGYGKYCLEMEVNDISMIEHSCPYYKEVPRKDLIDRLTREDKDRLLHAFIADYEEMKMQLKEANDSNKERVLVLTEPLCDLQTRTRIFKDVIEEYGKDATVVIKQHPRDELDYSIDFSGFIRLDKSVPMELLNFIPNVYFEKVVSIFTETKAIGYARDLIMLGSDFMDDYEDPALHRFNEQI